MVGSAPGYARPSLAQGAPSKVSTAGTSFVGIAAGALALLLVLGGIAALVAYLIDPRSLDFVIGGGKPLTKGAASARALLRLRARRRPSPAPSRGLRAEPEVGVDSVTPWFRAGDSVIA